MNQRSVCLFLGIKRLSATAIHRAVVEVLGFDVMAYSTVPKYLRSADFEVNGAGSDEGCDDPRTTFTDDRICHEFETSPFASVRQIARMRLFPKTTVCGHPTESLNFVNKKLHWVTHSVSEEQKRMRIEKSYELL
jgi:hypothetical protein